MLYAMMGQIIPWSIELRTYFFVVSEAFANVCKFLFRPANEAQIIINEYLCIPIMIVDLVL